VRPAGSCPSGPISGIQLPQREYRVPLPLVGYSVLLAISRVSALSVSQPRSLASPASLAFRFFYIIAARYLTIAFVLQSRYLAVPFCFHLLHSRYLTAHRFAFVSCRVGILQLIGLRSFPAEQVSYSLSLCVLCRVGILQLAYRSFSVEQVSYSLCRSFSVEQVSYGLSLVLCRAGIALTAHRSFSVEQVSCSSLSVLFPLSVLFLRTTSTSSPPCPSSTHSP
jgi:hypothetical protein